MASSATAVIPPRGNPPRDEFDRPVSFLRYTRTMPWSYDLQQAKHKEMLYRALNLGTSVVFLGAGSSRDFGLPNWKDFAKEAVLLAWLNLLQLRCNSQHREHHEEHRKQYEDNVGIFAMQLALQELNDHDKEELAARAQAHMKLQNAEVMVALNELQDAVRRREKSDGNRAKDPSADQLRFMLGACKEICKWCNSKDAERKNSFLEWLETRFEVVFDREPAKRAFEEQEGVHRKLLALPFHRFITSNYDLVLDGFLAQERLGLPLKGEKFKSFLEEKAFTQADRNTEKMARFAAGVSEDSRNMVFHCHGWYLKRDSMIVTEQDYQRWYLGDADGAGPAFRQTMELLVGSHPIVFIGFGMEDPDLLLAFRTLSATDPERKDKRSLFALLPEEQAKNGNATERFINQYGVHVIGYTVTKPERHSAELAYFLSQLDGEWKAARDSWLLKPKIHRVEVVPEQGRPNEYWHYELKPFRETEATRITLRKWEISESADGGKDASALPSFKPASSCTDVDKLVKKINEQQEARLIVLFGPGGSGKSFCAAQLAKRLLKRNDKYKCFFWSSYYADDALTGIIRANEFFNKFHTEEGNNRLDIFEKHLKRPQRILVFDGMERFLRPAKDWPDMGTAANGGVSNFLDILKKLCMKGTEYRATVVLTSRLAPEQLAEKDHGAVFFNVVPMTANEAANLEEFKSIPPHEQPTRTALVALLDGHRYAVDLAACWPHGRLDNLIHLLGNVGPLRHLERMIELTLCGLDQAPNRPGNAGENGIRDYEQCDGRRPYQLLMKRLAVFMGPIKETTFQHSWNLAENEWDRFQAEDKNLQGLGKFPDWKVMWDELLENKLLFLIERRPSAQKSCVMHAVVREFVFHHFHQADAHKLASFTQTGFTSGANMVDPGKKGAQIIEELFRELRHQCRKIFNSWDPEKNLKPEREDEIENARNLCQEAFGVLRSRMLANTVARWGPYSEYTGILVRMGDLARAYCGMGQKALLGNGEKSPQLFWNHFDPSLCADSKPFIFHKYGPLFDDELAWLYHELGLALYHEGAMIDCLAIWEQGLEVNRLLDGNQPGQYTFQAYCNLGAACIQYGRLPKARAYLQMAKEISLRTGNKDKDHIPRLNGYLALVHHLRGDLLLADEEYEKVIKFLRRSGNTRAECIFLSHRADLKLRLKQNDLAENFIRSSRAKAEEGHFPDLVAHARLSEGHLFRMREKYQDAIREYKIALKAAKEHGMRGLEADVHSEMARLALDLGDTETARTRAIKSLQIANELHLGLRQTHGLVVLGKATAEAGQRALGVEYLKQARELAERQHYELRAREAEEELHRLGATG